MFLRYWLPLLLWMSLIFIGSTDVLSAEHTSRFIGPFLRWLDPQISTGAVIKLQVLVRKAGHVTEYAILALLLVRALARTAFERTDLAICASLVLAGLFAASDEFHQSFVPTRTASVRDVMIDLGGATVGLVLYFCFERNALRKRSENGPERI